MTHRFNSRAEAELLGKRIRDERVSRNLSLIGLGKLSSTHHSQILRIERGEMVTANKAVQRICTALGISIHDAQNTGLTPAARIERLLSNSPEFESLVTRLIGELEDLAMRSKLPTIPPSSH